MENNKNIAINVTTWNDWQNTVECLESIFHSTYKSFDIILIDNNSEHHHLEKIYEWAQNKIYVEDEEFKFNPEKKIEIIEVENNLDIKNPGEKKIYLIKNKKNIGLTAGLNAGYKFSYKAKYDYIARVDCDFIITKQYLEKMIKVFETDKEIVALSPKVKHAFIRDSVWWKGITFNWF